jgi:hypothetical protein
LLTPSSWVYAKFRSKVGFILGTTSFVAVLFNYYHIPECGGRTVEESYKLRIQGAPTCKFAKAQTSTEDSRPSEAVPNVYGDELRRRRMDFS